MSNKVNVFEYVQIKHKFNRKGKDVLYYEVTKEYRYYSKRYKTLVVCPIGMISDGATGALDINSMSWLVHDRLCDTGRFWCGSVCNNWQASQVVSDILRKEKRWFRSFSWKWATWLFGGGKARRNGMMHI